MKPARFHRLLPALLIAAVGVPVSFGVGMRLAGNVNTISPTSASEVVSGDMDGNGTVDRTDVEIILKIAQGQREPTPHQLRADPNRDGNITVEDAMRVLRELPPT